MSKTKKKHNCFDLFSDIENQHNEFKTILQTQNSILERAPMLDLGLENDFDEILRNPIENRKEALISTTIDLDANDSITTISSKLQNEVETIEMPNTTSETGPRRSRRNKSISYENYFNDGNLVSESNIITSTRRGTQARKRRNNTSSAANSVSSGVPTTEVVDLINSPFQCVRETITIGSDDEDPPCLPLFTESRKKSKENSKTSFNAVNPLLSVKVIWKGSVETFHLRKYQKFSHLFQQLAERENTSPAKILLNIKEQIITPEDTLDSINYKIFSFIDGRVTDSDTNSSYAATKTKKQNRNNLILKVQSDKFKRPITITLCKSDQLKVLYIKCAEELNVPYDKLKLSFDGEVLKHTMTVAEAELEGDEIIDLNY